MWSSSAELGRRRFLELGLGAALTFLLPVPPSLARRTDRLRSEHAGPLGDILFVYDQCASPHLLREIVEILRHLPDSSVIHVLVSRPRREEACERLRPFQLRLQWIASEEEELSGAWGRDIFQLGRDRNGRCRVLVPWNKLATRREELDRGRRALARLESEARSVELLPVAAEGGNMMLDERAGVSTLFAGTTIAVETRNLYRAFYASDPGEEGVARILSEGLGVDRVVWIGPTEGDRRDRQCSYLFHVDMGMSIVREGIAVVGRCDPGELGEREHRLLLQEEARRTVRTLLEREAQGTPWPADLRLPRSESERSGFLEERLAEERLELALAAEQLEAMATLLQGEGYRVHRIPAPPRRVRRFQSYANVIPSQDRLIMPLYPTEERVHGWILDRAQGRDRVEVDLGIRDSRFDLEGDNLLALRAYRSLVEDVRAVRDYFYLASGNVHCVIGRLS